MHNVVIVVHGVGSCMLICVSDNESACPHYLETQLHILYMYYVAWLGLSRYTQKHMRPILKRFDSQKKTSSETDQLAKGNFIRLA